MSGYDTTYVFINQGKLKFLKVLQKNNGCSQSLMVSETPHAQQDKITAAWNVFLLALYWKRQGTRLNNLEYRQYISSFYRNKTNIASLPPPPTEAAAWQHRVNSVRARCDHVPIPTILNLAPDSMFQHISFKCKNCYEPNCRCRRPGLHCFSICKGMW